MLFCPCSNPGSVFRTGGNERMNTHFQGTFLVLREGSRTDDKVVPVEEREGSALNSEGKSPQEAAGDQDPLHLSRIVEHHLV